MQGCRYPLVVFDFDGTIADSRQAIVDLFQESMAAVGLGPVDAGEIATRIGLPLGQICAELSGYDEGHERCAALQGWYRERCFAGGLRGVGYFAGMQELILDLKAAGATLGIATGKAMRGLLENLDANHGRGDFASLATSDRVERGKPAPDLLEMVLEETGFAAKDAVLVGDTTHDVGMGLAAGVPVIGVSYGVHSEGELRAAGAEVVVDSVRGLRGVLLG